MLALIRGAGDIASGAAMRLWRCGIDVVMTDLERPTAIHARGDLRRNGRFFVHARKLRVTRAAVADLGNGSADAVDPDDRNNALRARRNDRLMRFMCLERQPLCPVRLHQPAAYEAAQAMAKELSCPVIAGSLHQGVYVCLH